MDYAIAMASHNKYAPQHGKTATHIKPRWSTALQYKSKIEVGNSMARYANDPTQVDHNSAWNTSTWAAQSLGNRHIKPRWTTAWPDNNQNQTHIDNNMVR